MREKERERGKKTGTFYKTTAAYGLSVFQRVKAGPFPYHGTVPMAPHRTRAPHGPYVHTHAPPNGRTIVVAARRLTPPRIAAPAPPHARTYVYAFPVHAVFDIHSFTPPPLACVCAELCCFFFFIPIISIYPDVVFRRTGSPKVVRRTPSFSITL